MVAVESLLIDVFYIRCPKYLILNNQIYKYVLVQILFAVMFYMDL